jgi:O-acetyl-ADP-ribose deacetylase (regulator of RNase III)
MNVKYIEGNIFNTKCQTIVNTVNCVGVMGKGIALVFKLRYPAMFDQYKKNCKTKEIRIGKVWLYKESKINWILNFPTKFHWKYDSKIVYLEKGLEDFLNIYKAKGITSIAFPLLGSHNGGLNPNIVKELMIEYLSKCDIPVEIYKYDPDASDDLFEDFKQKFLSMEYEEIKRATKLRRDKYQLVIDTLSNSEVKSMISLIKQEGLGVGTMQKCFNLILEDNNGFQLSMFKH